VDKRLATFFGVVAPALGAELARAQYVDLRYTNGFAVGWLEPNTADLARAPEAASRG
jgi:cell division septal protein FtsQ